MVNSNLVKDEIKKLHDLARLYGIQLAYKTTEKQLKQASVETLIAVLQSLGATISSIKDTFDAINEKYRSIWNELIEPVIVCWDGHLAPVHIRLSDMHKDSPITVRLVLENGEKQFWQVQDAGSFLPDVQTAVVHGRKYTIKHVILPVDLPVGYHHLTIEIAGSSADALIFSAPKRCYERNIDCNCRQWGFMTPLYALKSDNDPWGGGTFSCLEEIADVTADMGGNTIATLPMLAGFYGSSGELSPYFPASRLFWNEVYIDTDKIEQMGEISSVNKIMSSTGFQNGQRLLRNNPRFDYRNQMNLKRSILMEISRNLFNGGINNNPDYRDFVSRNPAVEDYAEFRSVGEKNNIGWPAWPDRQLSGKINPDDYDGENKRYHIAAQWIADSQIRSIYKNLSHRMMQLYFDFPLGISPDSYDVWRNKEVFLHGVAAGAPPDSFFTCGQNWGLAALHPEGIRKQGYRYYIDCLKHNLQYAGILRIDHVMAFQRLFVIPNGTIPTDGVYIRYRAPEFYALTAIESHRHRTEILGEDLGTVPAQVRLEMSRHGLKRHYVVQYEGVPKAQTAFPTMKQDMVGSINTHDMPTFAGYWSGSDIDLRVKLGLIDNEKRIEEFQNRVIVKNAIKLILQQKALIDSSSENYKDIVRGILTTLCESNLYLVIVNPEDLWAEVRPQNVPGTVDESNNYCRRFIFSIEEIARSEDVKIMLGHFYQRENPPDE